MPRTRSPRKGSMAVWPRKRAKRQHNRIRAWAAVDTPMALGFAGYKVGMTQALVKDNRKTIKAKDPERMIPITIIECPPIKVLGVRFYILDGYNIRAKTEILTKNVDKELKRSLNLQKKPEDKKLEDMNAQDYYDIKLIVYTQPGLTGFGKKRPEIFEMAIGGNLSQKLEYAKSVIGKEIKVTDVFKPGEQADSHSVSKGKGLQGPVKRFGIAIRSHKSEKTKRGAGSLGPWHPSKVKIHVSRSGQMGYHQRVQFNNWIIAINDKGEELNVKGGFINYGLIKNTAVVIRGSIPGPKKRIIKLLKSIKPNDKLPVNAPEIVYMSKESPQGN